MAATAPGKLTWLPEVVPARETLVLVFAWTLHATGLSDRAANAIAEVAARLETATDVARTL